MSANISVCFEGSDESTQREKHAVEKLSHTAALPLSQI